MKKKSAGWVAITAIFSWLLLRQHYKNKGATPAEKRYTLAEAGFKPHSIRAIDILATPEAVFAWLKQLGQNKGGFYSYTWLENALGFKIKDADEIHPAWQKLDLGDTVLISEKTAAEVTALIENHHLQLQFGGPLILFCWDFYLFSIADEAGLQPKTRLIAGTAVKGSPWVQQFWNYLGDMPHGIMEWGMLKGIQKRAELY